MKKGFILIVCIYLSLSIKAQIYIPSAGQQMVETAIANCFSIIEQLYQLEDTVTNQRFGRYGNENFGMSRTLAIKVGNGYLFNNAVLTPWVTDDNYDRYRNSHKPVLSKSYKIKLSDSIKTDFEIVPDASFNRLEHHVLIVDSTEIIEGFKTNSYTKPEDGWVVWISCDSTIKEYIPSQKVDLTIYKNRIEFSKDSASYAVEPPKVDKKIWGGIFIVPEQTAIGQLTFYLSGVFIKEFENDRWYMVPLLEDNLIPSQSLEDELTPLTHPSKKINKKRK